MSVESDSVVTVVSIKNLPPLFPTHLHDTEFWEYLGRTVATFGYLEEILGKAIFAITATRKYKENELEDAYEKWLPTLEKALYDSLGGLIGSYEKEVNDNPSFRGENFDRLIDELRKASKYRNALCHASWRSPDNEGRSRIFFVTQKMEMFDTPIDVSYLRDVQRQVAKLATTVMNTVIQTGIQFPGTSGPGRSIF